MKNFNSAISSALCLFFLTSPSVALSSNCKGSVERVHQQNVLFLKGQGVSIYTGMNINIDGSRRAYHRDNYKGGALLHFCNAGRPFFPDGSSYNASASNDACRQFHKDYQRIRKANWKDTSVGVIKWFGVYGKDSATIKGNSINSIVPVEQSDGSGYYVSPTKLEDNSFKEDDQRRYIEPLTVPAGVIRRNSDKLINAKVIPGSFGVAYNVEKKNLIPFIVGDTGPRLGEGTPALARLIAGLPINENITKDDRYKGAMSKAKILWVFFGGPKMKPPYDAKRVREEALAAFNKWGGKKRFKKCLANPKIPKNPH